MKTVRKAVLAASVAAALAPAVSFADSTIFGQIDVAVAVENSDETALVVEDSPAGDNILGIEGEVETESGNAVTYQYVLNLDVDGDGASGGGDVDFGTTYHAYIGYKWDAVELRAGTQDLPLRLALDKADQFAGTYADQNNVIGTQAGDSTYGVGNTTASNSVMLVGGSDTVKFAVSVDAGIDNVAEVSLVDDQTDLLRYGGMIDVSASDAFSFAVGVEHIKDGYTAVGASANIGLGDAAELSAAVNSYSEDGVGEDTTEYVVGFNTAVSDSTDLKIQIGGADVDNEDDQRFYGAIGLDFNVAETSTFYVLAAFGQDNGLATIDSTIEANGQTATIDEQDDGDASVLAAGWRVSF